MDAPHKKSALDTDAFSSVAFWQFLSFGILLCFAWVNEMFDLPHQVFGSDPSEPDFYRASMMTAAIITVGVVSVGHTYEKQKSLLRPLLMSCLYCHRVQIDKEKWMHVEEYFIQHYPIEMDRGACPDCQAMLQSVSARDGANKT
ncbi:MAG: hypothetical protein C0404_04320 [Verrucomicrobia bacterium]|nr:hypothetical protein [Verrucomicrobiota bacterium]